MRESEFEKRSDGHRQEAALAMRAVVMQDDAELALRALAANPGAFFQRLRNKGLESPAPSRASNACSAMGLALRSASGEFCEAFGRGMQEPPEGWEVRLGRVARECWGVKSPAHGAIAKTLHRNMSAFARGLDAGAAPPGLFAARLVYVGCVGDGDDSLDADREMRGVAWSASSFEAAALWQAGWLGAKASVDARAAESGDPAHPAPARWRGLLGERWAAMCAQAPRSLDGPEAMEEHAARAVEGFEAAWSWLGSMALACSREGWLDASELAGARMGGAVAFGRSAAAAAWDSPSFGPGGPGAHALGSMVRAAGAEFGLAALAAFDPHWRRLLANERADPKGWGEGPELSMRGGRRPLGHRGGHSFDGGAAGRSA